MILLQLSGAVDVDMAALSTDELEAHALNNTWRDGVEWGYLVRHGSRPQNEFGRDRGQHAHQDNLFERAFPVLYPYGVGGIEGDQRNPLEFVKHVRWSLQYHDRRFRTHPTFAFMAFGILQKREAMGSARLQMKRRDFDKHAATITSLDPARLKAAAAEESKGRPVSDPAVRLLKKHLYAGIGRVMGSNQSRYQLRSQIWSTAIRKGPPSIWITINPSDIHDPIAQVFAGEAIDLD